MLMLLRGEEDACVRSTTREHQKNMETHEHFQDVDGLKDLQAEVFVNLAETPSIQTANKHSRNVKARNRCMLSEIQPSHRDQGKKQLKYGEDVSTCKNMAPLTPVVKPALYSIIDISVNVDEPNVSKRCFFYPNDDDVEESKSNYEWHFEGEMLAAFGKDVEMCMRAVCALYRHQTSDEKTSKETIYHKGRDFSLCNASKSFLLGVIQKVISNQNGGGTRRVQCRDLSCAKLWHLTTLINCSESTRIKKIPFSYPPDTNLSSKSEDRLCGAPPVVHCHYPPLSSQQGREGSTVSELSIIAVHSFTQSFTPKISDLQFCCWREKEENGGEQQGLVDHVSSNESHYVNGFSSVCNGSITCPCPSSRQ